MDSQVDRTRLIVPGMAGVYQRFAPYSYAFMRFVTGAILVPHGIQKVFNAPIDRYVTNIGGKGIPFPELLPTWCSSPSRSARSASPSDCSRASPPPWSASRCW